MFVLFMVFLGRTKALYSVSQKSLPPAIIYLFMEIGIFALGKVYATKGKVSYDTKRKLTYDNFQPFLPTQSSCPCNKYKLSFVV